MNDEVKKILEKILDKDCNNWDWHDKFIITSEYLHVIIEETKREGNISDARVAYLAVGLCDLFETNGDARVRIVLSGSLEEKC